MIETSEEFIESLSGDVQIVRPSVSAWMSDLRTLENLKVYTSSHTISKQISDRDPLVYLKFDKTDFDAVKSGANYYDAVKDYGSLKFNFGYTNNALTPTVNSYLNSYAMSDDIIEVIEPKYLMHTFELDNANSLGYFVNVGDTDPELHYYSFAFSPGSKWYASSGRAYWFNSSSRYNNIPVYFYLNMRCLDHFVDFRTANVGFDGGLGAIVRYVDDENYVYCRQTRSGGSSLNSLAIYKVVNNVHTLVAGIDSTRFSTSNYYRFEAKYNTFTVYDLGASVPSEATVGTVMTDGTKNLTCYIDEPIFRSSGATSVGLLNAGTGTYNPGYTPGGATFAFEHFASYGYNYLVGGHKFSEDKAVIADTSIFQNLASQYSSITSMSDFTLSFLFKKDATGSEAAQTIFWLGSSTPTTSIRVAYITATGKLQIKMVDTANNVYTLNSATTISNNVLYNMQVVKNGTNIELYISGVLNSSLDTGSDFFLKESSSIIAFGGDLAGTSLGDTNTKHLLNGYISEFAIYNYAFNESDAMSFFESTYNGGTLYSVTSNDYCNAECIVDGLLEESLPYAFTNQLSHVGRPTAVDGRHFLTDAEDTTSFVDNVEDNYGWTSRVESNASGIFGNVDFVEIRFDPSPCNKIFVSTSFYSGRVDDFSYTVEKSSGAVVSGSGSFAGESVATIDLGETLEIVSVKITPTSTINPYDYARLFTINPIWEVDLSDYVVSFSVDKVRENLDSSLPIGATAANNGTLVLDNTDQVFNIFGNTLYGKYAIPDTRLFFSLTHELLDYGTEETVPVSYDMYADTWSFDNSSMTVEVSFRDYSKYLQEKTVDGYVNQGIIAGRGIAEILMTSGFPARKINYIERFEDVVFDDNPYIYIPFDFSAEDIQNSVTPPSTVVTIDDADKCDVVIISHPLDRRLSVGGNLVYSETLSSNADIRRQDDFGLIETFESSFINRSIKSSGLYWEIFTKPDGTDHLDFFSGHTDEWTIEMLYYAPESEFYSPGYENIVSDDVYGSFVLSSSVNASQIQYRWGFANSSNTYTYIYSGWLLRDQPHHIVVRKTRTTTNKYDLFIDGELVDTVTSNSTFSTTNPKEVRIAQGFISHLTFYKEPIADARILKHYISSAVPYLPVYRYLYASGETYWDAMLKIATADLGMFYLDEYGLFQYEYRETLHQDYISRYQTSQYTLSDNTNILSGSYVNEIQTNKASVSVNNISLSGYSYEAIWNAPTNESLAVTTLTSDVYINSSSLPLSSTADPQWPDSGYVKIDNEIIKYSYIAGNSLGGIERGLFNTEPAYHISGSKVREARSYEAIYSSSPATSVKYPLITNDKVDIDYYVSNSYKTNIVVSLNSSVDAGEIEMLNGKNPKTEIEDFFEIVGIPVSISSSKELISSVAAEIRDNIRKYGIKELQVDNEFIQNKKYAEIFVNHIISYYKNPIRNLSISTLAVPVLQLGDLITIEQFADLGIVDEKFWVISNAISFDGTLQQSLSLLSYTQTADPVEFTFGSIAAPNSSGGGFVYTTFF